MESNADVYRQLQRHIDNMPIEPAHKLKIGRLKITKM